MTPAERAKQIVSEFNNNFRLYGSTDLLEQRITSALTIPANHVRDEHGNDMRVLGTLGTEEQTTGPGITGEINEDYDLPPLERCFSRRFVIRRDRTLPVPSHLRTEGTQMKALTFIYRLLILAALTLLVMLGFELRKQTVLFRHDVQGLPDQVRRALEVK